MDTKVTKLRHAYYNLIHGYVKDAREFADGLIAPVIRELEKENENRRSWKSEDKDTEDQRKNT